MVMAKHSPLRLWAGVVLIAAVAVLPGCSDSLAPRGIGSAADDLKRSPCACLEVPQLRPGMPQLRPGMEVST